MQQSSSQCCIHFHFAAASILNCCLELTNRQHHDVLPVHAELPRGVALLLQLVGDEDVLRHRGLARPQLVQHLRQNP